MTGFLPTTIEEIEARGWLVPDFLFISGDAYVDHPAFAAAVILLASLKRKAIK